jgi:hypothetical protein
MAKGEGYLMIDHRASPGIPEALARAIGLDPAAVAEGQLLEMATMTCIHCKIVQQRNPLRMRERHNCKKCMHYICDFCYADMQRSDYSHAPYEAKAELAVRQSAQTFYSPPPPTLILPPTD